jgi:hypothetical protein
MAPLLAGQRFAGQINHALSLSSSFHGNLA